MNQIRTFQFAEFFYVKYLRPIKYEPNKDSLRQLREFIKIPFVGFLDTGF
jgi:hypothetical protein